MDFGDLDDIGHVGRIVQLALAAIGHEQLVDDGRGGGDQVEVELALKALLDDFEMQQSEEAAAEAEAERRG